MSQQVTAPRAAQNMLLCAAMHSNIELAHSHVNSGTS